jgi:hypothetical protein
MFKLLALTCLVAVAVATKNDDRISVSPSSTDETPIVVQEGFKQLFTFRLKQPIACPAGILSRHLVVFVSILPFAGNR